MASRPGAADDSSSQGEAAAAVKPAQVPRVVWAGAVQLRQPDLHQPAKHATLQFAKPYCAVA